MPFLENLVQGLSSAAGNTDAVNAIQKVKDNRRATADEELHAKSKQIWNDVESIQGKLAALPQGDPARAPLEKSLHDHMVAFKDLYHPEKNPGALQKLGGFLKQHIGGKPPAAPPKSNAVTPDRMAGLASSAAGAQPADPYLTPDQLKHKALVAAGLEPRAVEPKPEQENWKTETISLSDGRQLTVQHNTKDGTWLDLNNKPIPPELLSGATIAPKAGAAPKIGSFGDFLKRAFGDNPTSEQYQEARKIWATSGATGRTTTGFHYWKDDDGFIHQTEETKTSTPSGQGGSSVPKTPGEAKKKAAAVAPPKEPKDKVIGHSETPVQAKAHNTYIAAFQLSKAADLAAKEPENAQSQKSLAVALERAAAGRFTTQALDYILKAGWSAGAEQFWNNIDNGTLPKQVFQNLIQRAHDNKESAYSAWQEAKKPSGGSTNDDDEFLKKF